MLKIIPGMCNLRIFSTMGCLLVVAVYCRAGIFLARPGEGEEYVYSPVGMNATLSCVVNVTVLLWGINGTYFTVSTPSLTSKGIFFRSSTRSDGRAESFLLVMGNLNDNNDTRICCRTYALMEQDSCTTLIIYDRPSPPENVSVRYFKSSDLIIISWSATTMTGVYQTYMIIFKVCTLETANGVICVNQHYTTNLESYEVGETTQLYYLYRQNTSDSEIVCSTYVTAVNGAGESDPSNNVTIPSLPDIGPVTASLSHQVWKSAGGEIMVNVSFKPALYCVKYPVSSYLLKLRSEESEGSEVEKSLGSNETEVTIEPSDGLKENRKYQYTVTARNSVGNTTSNERVLVTSDVQSVIATVVRESTIDIQCLFIHWSDAVGCKVVLVSDHTGVNNETKTLLKKNTSAFGQLKLTHQVGCYHRVLAYTINVDNSTSNFIIMKMLNFGTNNYSCLEGGSNINITIKTIIGVSVGCVMVVMVIMLIMVTVSVVRSKESHCHDQDNNDTTDEDLQTNPNPAYEMVTF